SIRSEPPLTNASWDAWIATAPAPSILTQYSYTSSIAREIRRPVRAPGEASAVARHVLRLRLLIEPARLERNPVLVPAQFGAHRRRDSQPHLATRLADRSRGDKAEPRPPQQHIPHAQRLFARNRERRLGEEIWMTCHDRRRQLGPTRGKVEQIVG